ncbi:MAG: VanZ family protein, partial [Planctomycetota bacterium]
MDRTASVPPEADRRLQRSWRRASIAYALLLTTGTHWPNLRFGEEMPASDKTVHLLAFAGLTVLVARTGWVGSPWRAGLAVGLWSILDELTQALPGLGRDVGLPDMVANLLGCLLAAAWLGAIGPAGGPPARWRHAMLRATLDRVLAKAWPWLLAGGLGGLSWAMYAAMRRFDPPLPPVAGLGRVMFERGVVLGTAIAAAHVGVL